MSPSNYMQQIQNASQLQQLQNILQDLQYDGVIDNKDQLRNRIQQKKRNLPTQGQLLQADAKRIQEYGLKEWFILNYPEKQTALFFPLEVRHKIIKQNQSAPKLQQQKIQKIKKLFAQSKKEEGKFQVSEGKIRKKRHVRISLECPQQKKRFYNSAIQKLLGKSPEAKLRYTQLLNWLEEMPESQKTKFPNFEQYKRRIQQIVG